jgi:hypothetical protein
MLFSAVQANDYLPIMNCSGRFTEINLEELGNKKRSNCVIIKEQVRLYEGLAYHENKDGSVGITYYPIISKKSSSFREYPIVKKVALIARTLEFKKKEEINNLENVVSDRMLQGVIIGTAEDVPEKYIKVMKEKYSEIELDNVLWIKETTFINESPLGLLLFILSLFSVMVIISLYIADIYKKHKKKY